MSKRSEFDKTVVAKPCDKIASTLGLQTPKTLKATLVFEVSAIES